MQDITTKLGKLADKLSLPVILGIIIFLNVYWGITLNAFGTYFEQIAGQPLLDLQNVGGILSVQEATQLITSYSSEAKTLYWIFFILDNLMPPIVFGSFILLWVFLFQRMPQKWGMWLSKSGCILIPLGVGFFDCMENLAFVSAMVGDADLVPSIMRFGILCVYPKAMCLFTTFLTTIALICVSVIYQIRNRVIAKPMPTAPRR